MKFSIIVLLAVFSSAFTQAFGQSKHLCLSAHQLVKAINVPRMYPKKFAQHLKEGPMKGGSVRGVSGDSNCYGEALGILNSMKPMPQLKESLALDLASLRTTYKMQEKKQMSHNVEGTPWSRMDMFASSKTCCGENIAWSSAPKSCFIFTNMWFSDCRVMSRGHRKNILKKDFNEVGAHSNGYYATMQGCGSITVKTQYAGKDYSDFGIYAKYDHKAVPASAITDDYNKADF